MDPNYPKLLPNLRTQQLESILMVNSLKLANGAWNDDLLELLFDQESVRHIKGIFQTRNDQKDKVIWPNSKSSLFTVKSAYALEEGREPAGDKWWNFLWRSKLHERTKIFMWNVTA